MWNKSFWAFFGTAEALVIFMSAYQSFEYILSGAAMVPLALWKLAEDVERSSGKKAPLVRKSILRKLKKRPQL
jgi:hypothetical protein